MEPGSKLRNINKKGFFFILNKSDRGSLFTVRMMDTLKKNVILFKKNINRLRVTVFILEVDPFGFQHLQGDVDVVDLLKATDGGQTQLRRQTPIQSEELHHTTAGTSHF